MKIYVKKKKHSKRVLIVCSNKKDAKYLYSKLDMSLVALMNERDKPDNLIGFRFDDPGERDVQA
jgi:hypothetical protein